MIIARTPFRISFFGGGTDFPSYYSRYGGAALSTTINQYCYLSVHRLTPFFKHRYRASYARTETVQSPREFQHPLIRECLLMLEQDEGLEITHVADLPARTGLGTSSAFTVGLLNALHAYRGEPTAPAQLAREAVCIERSRVGDPGGCQDQYAAAFGGLNHMRFDPDGTVDIAPLPLPPATRQALEERLMLFYLGEERCSRSVLQRQEKRAMENRDALRAMNACTEAAVEALQGGDLDAFGTLLEESWTRKKTLAEGVTSPEIDRAYDAARRAGASGGKLLGAGGGGFLLLYAHCEAHPEVSRALQHLAEVPFGFSPEGSRIIFNDQDG